MKLLIADDEPEVIDGIQNLIDWNRYGIEVCAIAYNGEQALELIKSYDPDIVLIDIKMPKLNGLEAIEAAKKSGFQFETIILSGYDDFYFAQKAITLQTSNYLLKPCKPEEILETVLKAKQHLEKEAEKKALFEKYQKYFYEHLPVLKERILNEVLLGIRTSQAEISETFKKYNINLEGNFYRVIIIKPEPAHDFEHNFKSISIETIKIALMDTITEYLLDYNHYCKLYFEIFQSKDDIVLVIGAYESLQKGKLEGLLKNLAEYVFSKTSIYLYFLIGNEVNSLEMLNKSYREAFSIVELKFFLEDENILFFEDIYFENSFSYPLEEEKEIMTCMALKNKCELDEKINKFFHKLFSQSTSDKKVIKSALYSFVGTMIKLCFEKNIILSNSDINQVFEAISKNDKIADVKKVVISFVNLIMDNILKSESKNYIVAKATEYISKNYSQNITLESVAKEVYVTPTYLSILFKRELGINFTDYLHKFRIQKAQEFLKNKALKTYQVANLVGYQDEKYFSQIFKKYTGLSPSQYRESLL